MVTSIPKGVIRRIEGICRNYLWDGSSDYHRVPLVAWDKVTLPKDEGGLGIKKAELCNIAAMAKLVDWVYNKADKLWIKWISQVYLKQQDWHTYTPAAGVAWSWKSICKVKEIMKAGYQNDQWSANLKAYSIREWYEWLRNKQPKKDWVQLVWNDWNIPKHALISWLVMNQGLNIKAKLFQFGCCPDNRCCICDQEPETLEHLFFDCLYSRQVLSLIEQWRGLKIAVDFYASNGRNAGARLKMHTHYLLWSACFYHIWSQRNNSRVNLILTRPESLVMQIREDVMRRIRSKLGRPAVNEERTWLQRWGIVV
ncbi:uncharacterized protein LOC141619155 [Silene latifolia]|uniref:uncharacterized protein LOC141619155 n=1 Tax=Silene latifolia TaxID=37657 RepID=UPI003D77069F